MAVPLRKTDYNTNHYGRGEKRKYIIIILIASLILGGYVLDEIKLSNHNKLRNYLDQRQQFFSSSDSEYKQLLNQIYQGNNISTIYSSIQQTGSLLTQNFNRLQELIPPKKFETLHNQTNQWFIQVISSVDYLETTSLNNTYQASEFNVYVNESNKVLSTLKPSLIDGLQKSDIRYEVEEDGHITYWLLEGANLEKVK